MMENLNPVVQLRQNSFPRSGGSYLRALLALNFPSIVWGKPLFDVRRPDTTPAEFLDGSWHHIYIWRRFEDVAASYCARADTEVSLHQFKHLSWNDLYDVWHETPSIAYPKGRWPGFVPVHERTMTPFAWWCAHIESWVKFSETREDVHVLTYEQLTTEFQETMLGISKWLNFDRDNFENVHLKVDGDPVRPGGFTGESTGPYGGAVALTNFIEEYCNEGF